MIDRRTLLFSGAAALAPRAVFGEAAPPSTPVSVSGSESGWVAFNHTQDRITFAGEANGFPVGIVLDSGANEIVIDTGLAHRLGLRPTGQFITQGLAGATNSQVAGPIALSVGNLVLRVPSVAVVDMTAIRQAGGIFDLVLGRPIFEAGVVSISYPSSRLAIESKSRFKAPDHSVSVALLPTSSGLRRVEISIEGHPPAWGVLDLGNDSALSISEAYAAHGGFLTGRPVSTWIAAGVDGITTYKVASVTEISLAGVQFRHVPFDAVSQWLLPETPVNIGAPILSRFSSISLYYSSDRMWLGVDGVAVSAPFDRNRSGIAAAVVGEAVKILHVAPGSPADIAHFRSGEVISKIDGMSAVQIYGGARRYWGDGPAGTSVKLTMADGSTRTIVLSDYY